MITRILDSLRIIPLIVIIASFGLILITLITLQPKWVKLDRGNKYRWKKNLENIDFFLRPVSKTIVVISTILLVLKLVTLYNAGQFDPAIREASAQFSQTNGTWVASDNSLRMHFFLDESYSPPERYIQEGKTYSPPYLVDVAVANLQTGSAQLIPYSLTKQNHDLEYDASYKYIDSENKEWTAQPLYSDLPLKFAITEFGENSLVVQIQDQLPLRYVKVNRPNSLEELADYSSKYSTEEYLSVIAGEFPSLIYKYGGKMTFERSLGEKYTIYIKDVLLKYDASRLSGGGPLMPGENAPLIIPPLRSLLSPISDKIEAIYYTEMWRSMGPEGAHWIARYTVSSSSWDVIEDTATGKEVYIEYVK